MKLISCQVFLAVASTVLFTGCVDPYFAGGSAVITTHRPGYVVTALPTGYRTEVIGGTRYYYHQDVYYRPEGRGYVVVDSPHRHRGGQHSGGPYSEWDRQPERNDPRYGGSVQVIRQLPRGYEVVTHRGTRYYRAGNVYYQSRGEGYIVVRSPF